MDLLNKGKAIYTGWSNYMKLEDLPEGLKKKAEKRGKICAECEYLKVSWLVQLLAHFGIVREGDRYICTGGCGGCPIAQKVLQDIEPCPKGKW